MAVLVSYHTVLAIGRTLKALSEESPLNKLSQKEFEIAVYDLGLISNESNIREGLNRCLTHLESAFTTYHPSTWDIWDKDRVLWDKRTFKNSICVLISVIHYLLGNKSIAKQWLLDNLTDMGHVYFPEDLLKELSVPNEIAFYSIIGCDEELKSLKASSDWNFRCVFDLDNHSESSGFDNFY